MTWVAVGGAGVSLLGGLFSKKKDKQVQQQLTTNLGYSDISGTGGLKGWSGENGSGYSLGMMTDAFNQNWQLSQGAGFGAHNALARGVPQEVVAASDALNNQDPSLGAYAAGERGAGMLSNQAMFDAFNPNNTADSVRQRQLGLMRAEAQPGEQQATRNFMSNLYGSGRGAVTGAPGAESTMGGGRLAAAFGQGLGQADLSRQIAAQQQGESAATNRENILQSMFGRFADSSQLGASMNEASFNRQRGMLEGAYGRAVDQQTMPIDIAGAFQNLSNSGIGQMINLSNLGLDTAQLGLNTSQAAANARLGSGSNIAGYMQGRSQTPVLDAVGSGLAGMASAGGSGGGNLFQNVWGKIGDKRAGVVGRGTSSNAVYDPLQG